MTKIFIKKRIELKAGLSHPKKQSAQTTSKMSPLTEAGLNRPIILSLNPHSLISSTFSSLTYVLESLFSH